MVDQTDCSGDRRENRGREDNESPVFSIGPEPLHLDRSVDSNQLS